MIESSSANTNSYCHADLRSPGKPQIPPKGAAMKLLAVLIVVLTLCTANSNAEPAKPVKVFILAGQSNMEGKAKVSLLEYQAKQPATADLYKHLRKDDHWIERDDVWIKFLDRKGKLTVGYGSPHCIGPELGFGNVDGRSLRRASAAHQDRMGRPQPLSRLSPAERRLSAGQGARQDARGSCGRRNRKRRSTT